MFPFPSQAAPPMMPPPGLPGDVGGGPDPAMLMAALAGGMPGMGGGSDFATETLRSLGQNLDPAAGQALLDEMLQQALGLGRGVVPGQPMLGPDSPMPGMAPPVMMPTAPNAGMALPPTPPGMPPLGPPGMGMPGMPPGMPGQMPPGISPPMPPMPPGPGRPY